MNKTYQVINDRILAELKKGTVPWRKPWSSGQSEPENLTTRKKYRGINIWLTNSAGYDSPYWLTFRQAKKLGGNVNKGEKATPVIFWKWYEKELKDPDTGKTAVRSVPVLRMYHVFNSAQCTLPDGKVPEIETEGDTLDFEPIDKAQEIVDGMPTRPVIRHGRDRAVYSPFFDSVGMPSREAFHSCEEYYSTLFHELAHSTGHTSRLGRFDDNENPSFFGSQSYSKEELVAEFTAAFLCGRSGIENATIENSAAYIDNWHRTLKRSPKMLIHAAAAAQKAAEYILDERQVA